MELSDLFGQEDSPSDLSQFPSFRGPRPRRRALAETPTAVPTAPPTLPSASSPPLQPSEIEAAKERLKALMARMERRTLEDALEIGREALRVCRALSHGEVGRWLKETFGQRRARTIYNWIGMAEYSEKRPQEFANFSILDATSVYLLTAPKTPHSVVEAIIAQIAAGQMPGVHSVRAEISRAKQLRPDAHRARDDSVAVRRDRPRANGLAALWQVALLIPSHHRQDASGLLREALAAGCGLHDLLTAFAEAPHH